MSQPTTQERHEIAERLSEIKVQTDTIRSNPSASDERLLEDLNRETTELLRQLAESGEAPQ